MVRSLLPMRKRRRLLRLADSIPFWFHSIDLGSGVTTGGAKAPALLRSELESFRLPDLTGKTFLDIGAWDGYFSFAAERLGASRVVALDHYVWSGKPRLDLSPDQLPDKKRGFDIAREALGSKVEAVRGDFMTMDLDELGSFDMVLFAGVLYHLKDPLGALGRLARVTRELAVIETLAVEVPGFERSALTEFYEVDEVNADPTNWWGPNERALIALCRAAGFAHARRVSSRDPEATPEGVRRYRLVAHALKRAE